MDSLHASVSPQGDTETAIHHTTLFSSPRGSSMIAILAMPQMKTRVAATIYKSSGECGACSLAYFTLREEGVSKRKGQSEHKISGRVEGCSLCPAQRVLQPSKE